MTVHNVFVITKNTFKETIRDRILYGLVAFGALFILLDLFLAKLSLGDMVMIKSFGLAGVYLIGTIITVFLGASIIYREVEKRTLYFVLSKPASYGDVILGKFFGLYGAAILTVLLMAAVYLGVVLYQGGGFDVRGFVAILYQLLEAGFFVALLTFLSAISTPLTSTIAAALILFSGHFMSTAVENVKRIGGFTKTFIDAAYYLLPNLEKFNVRNVVVHHVPLSLEPFILSAAYAAFYAAVLLYFAYAFLKRKEL